MPGPSLLNSDDRVIELLNAIVARLDRMQSDISVMNEGLTKHAEHDLVEEARWNAT